MAPESERAKDEQNCTFKGCTNRGKPQDGFDFFVCEACFDDFGDALRKAYASKMLKQAQNN